MAGQIKQMIESIIEQRAHGSELLRNTTKTKLMLKGLDPSKYGANSPDDYEIIRQLRTIAAELGVKV